MIQNQRNDRAIVSRFVIQEPSGSVGNESRRLSVLHGRVGDEENTVTRRYIELKIALIKPQKMSEVFGRLKCSEHSSDVAVGVQ